MDYNTVWGNYQKALKRIDYLENENKRLKKIGSTKKSGKIDQKKGTRGIK